LQSNSLLILLLLQVHNRPIKQK